MGLAYLQFSKAAAGDATYFWKSNDVLRFEYSKTISIEEDTNADEVFSDRPAYLNQAAAEVFEFTLPDGDTSGDSPDDPHRLGTAKAVMALKLGDAFTLTGVIKEDERHAKWVEIRNAEGVGGFVPGTTKVQDTREFSFDAILIVEVKNRTPTGTFGVLHFDSAHIVMPESYTFAPQADDPTVQKDRAKMILHALEGAIKLARWNVILDQNGIVRIDTRVPKGLDDWLKETEHAAFWRGKFRKLWMEIVEKDLALLPAGEDRDMFLAVNSPAVVPAGELEKIRPYRSAAKLISSKNGKAEFDFERLAPPRAGQPYALPYVGGPTDPKTPSIFMTLKVPIRGPITENDPKPPGAQIGSAVVDTKLNMLDTLSEAYSFETEYACDEDKRRHYRIAQKVSVKYYLKRLAPPIAGRIEQAVEAPLHPR